MKLVSVRPTPRPCPRLTHSPFCFGSPLPPRNPGAPLPGRALPSLGLWSLRAYVSQEPGLSVLWGNRLGYTQIPSLALQVEALGNLNLPEPQYKIETLVPLCESTRRH